jgi:TPR repeat protein
MAADQGYAQAQTKLGAMYFLGEGVAQDYAAAHMHSNIGCALGFEDGCKLRDTIAKYMIPADISEAQRRARVCMKSDYKDCD